MKIAVSGSHGMVGSDFIARLHGQDEILRLVRKGGHEQGIIWDPVAGTIDAAKLEGLDAVVHLAGETISSRWNAERKARIRDSRVAGTSLLARTLAGLAKPPRVMICASAIGYYGSRGDEMLDENSPPANDFLGSVCQEWENAAKPAVERGIRVVHLRFGVILSPRGGALAKMLLPFKLGAGGRIGDGRQYMSWISLEDAVRLIEFSIQHNELKGACNAVSPEPVTNQEFTRTLGRALCRPTIFPVPAFAARLVFGEMADALLLSSARVMPRRLQSAGFSFRTPDLASALKLELNRK